MFNKLFLDRAIKDYRAHTDNNVSFLLSRLMVTISKPRRAFNVVVKWARDEKEKKKNILSES